MSLSRTPPEIESRSALSEAKRSRRAFRSVSSQARQLAAELLDRKLDGKAGFRVKTREGRDTIAKIYCDGKPILFTRVSHGKGALEGKLVHYIRNQLKLSEDDFRNLIRCTLSVTEYKAILKNKGFL